ncbi:MAG: hypothetical protein IJ047_02020 [Paludibacteraceae bacterium]|nr:hypothetical protein [Paludibacteraceae bacterium]
MTQQRISYIDLGAGIMILWMILGHAFSTSHGMEITLHELWDVTDASLIPEGVHAKIGSDGHIRGMGLGAYIPSVLFFFMPWFFYKSGQFFNKRSISDEWNKDWNKLMRQFLIWSVIGYVLHITFLSIDGVITLRNATYSVLRGFFLNGHIELNVPLWFLFTLFIVRQIANVLLPKEEDSYYWIKCIGLIVICFAVAFGCYCTNFRLMPLWVANGAAGLAYFTLGYCLRRYETKWWLLVPCVLGYVACCIWGFPEVGMRSNECSSMLKYIAWMPGSLAGIVSFNMLCRLISKYLHYLSLPFEYIGKYAMIIYVSHGILYITISRALVSFDLTTLMPYTIWLILCSYVLFLPAFCYFIPRLSLLLSSK